jgi:hypothetical protein
VTHQHHWATGDAADVGAESAEVVKPSMVPSGLDEDDDRCSVKVGGQRRAAAPEQHCVRAEAAARIQRGHRPPGAAMHSAIT